MILSKPATLALLSFCQGQPIDPLSLHLDGWGTITMATDDEELTPWSA